MDTAMEMGIAAAQNLMLDNLWKKEDVQLMRSEKELMRSITKDVIVNRRKRWILDM